MKSIGLLVHPAMPRAKQAAQELKGIAEARNLQLVEASNEQGADVILALGGDGTILRAAQVASYHDVPLLGANLGKLGFLSTIDVARLDEVVDGLVAGAFRVENRMMLDASAEHNGAKSNQVSALNEVVIERGALSRVVSIEVCVGGEKVATYRADGFIVSSPTGSTAYSLSAGGPLVEPEVRAMVLTSVSAHSPLWRSIVVGPERSVTLQTPRDAVAFSADGQPVGILQPPSRVVIKPHPKPLRLIGFDGSRFYEKLRSRFDVRPVGGEDPRE